MRSLETGSWPHASVSARKAPCSARFAGFGVLALLLLLATDARAGELWWTAQGVDDSWNTYGNWVQDEGIAVPDEGASAYITTSEHEGLAELPAAVVDETMAAHAQARTEQLYVGGWLSHLDAAHGDATAHRGELRIAGGEIVVDHYTRLGTRGAEGTISQTGGTLYTNTAISLGWLHPESLGTYNLSGGDVVTRYVDIGLQGTGSFNMTGGHVLWGPNTSSVGQGFSAGDGRYVPGHGFLYVGGGIFEASGFWVGRFEGSTGEIAVEDDGVLFVSGDVLVGDLGTGSILQSGGSIEIGRSILLGKRRGGDGLLRIDGGTLFSNGLHVGVGGAGTLEVEGAAGEIEIDGVYTQNKLSLLSVTLDASDDHVTPIQVGRTARFARGASLQIRQAPGYTPSVGDAFVLLTAREGVRNFGLQIVGSQQNHWLLDTSAGNDVTVVYIGPPKGKGKGGKND